MFRNENQAKEWNYYSSMDNRSIYLSNKSKSVSIDTLKEVLLKDYSNGTFIIYDFIKSLYIIVQKELYDAIRNLNSENYLFWVSFSNDYKELLTANINDNEIWDRWLLVLKKYNILIKNIIITKTAYLGFRKYYGIYNFSKLPLHGERLNYKSQGEWVRVTIPNDRNLYGRIHRFVYLDIDFNAIIKQDFLITQFYDWVTESLIDDISGYPIGLDNDISMLDEGFFYSIYYIYQKVCLQPIWHNPMDIYPIKGRSLIVPYYAWNT